MRTLIAVVFIFLSPFAARAESTPFDNATPIEIGEQFLIDSIALGAARRVNVWLPASYATSDERYPVLYLIDGGLVQDFHHISGLAQLGEVAAMFRSVIVVGVETIDRQKELTSPVDQALYRQEFPTHGKGAAFRAFITDEVMPNVTTRYRTSGETAVIGESLAGLFIVETFLKTPGAFDHYIAISPSLWWEDGAFGNSAAADIGASDDAPRSIYLALADEGPQTTAATKKLVNALGRSKRKNLRWTFSDRPDLQHSTIYHREALEGLVWTFPLDADESTD